MEVRGDDGPLALGGRKQRAVLALLILNANRVVSRDRLVDELWGEEPPATAAATVQVNVSRLRKVLPANVLETRSPGYVLAWVYPDAWPLGAREDGRDRGKPVTEARPRRLGALARC